jgi:hypothetical protein
LGEKMGDRIRKPLSKRHHINVLFALMAERESVLMGFYGTTRNPIFYYINQCVNHT